MVVMTEFLIEYGTIPILAIIDAIALLIAGVLLFGSALAWHLNAVTNGLYS